MRVNYKTFPFLLSSLIVIGTTACGGKVDTEEKVVSSEITAELRNPTAEDFSKITVCGTEFSLPCKPDDFSGDFSVKEEENNKYYNIYCKDTLVGHVMKATNDTENLLLYSFNEDSKFSIGYFSVLMHYDDVERIFGKPTKEFKDDNGVIMVVHYEFDDFTVMFDSVMVEEPSEVNNITFIYKMQEDIWQFN